VLSLQRAIIRTSPAGIPNNWYKSIWFKVVFNFCPKIKVVKMVFWPYYCEEEEETSTLVKTTQKSDIEHDRTCLRGVYPRAQMHPTRLLCQDGLTQPEYQTTRPMCMTWMRMTSAWRNCYVSDQSADMSAQWVPHATSSASSRAGFEPRDRIQCGWSYVQEDVRLNMGRWLGQNCFA
jgi:hypothetical protein